MYLYKFKLHAQCIFTDSKYLRDEFDIPILLISTNNITANLRYIIPSILFKICTKAPKHVSYRNYNINLSI